MHSVWVLTSPTFPLLFITICRKILKATIRRQDVRDVTVNLLPAYFFTAVRTLSPINFLLKIQTRKMKSFPNTNFVYSKKRIWTDLKK